MWINTAKTEDMRQNLEAEFCMHLAIEQRFPSHPTQGVKYRIYRTDCRGDEVESFNPADLRQAIINRKI